jgi:hypothetical protein
VAGRSGRAAWRPRVGDTQEGAVAKVQALALRVIAERLEHGEAGPELWVGSQASVGLFVFAFHDDDEIGPRMLARIAKRTGLQSEDLEGYQRTPRSSGRASRAAHRARSTDMRSERGGT